MSKTTKLFSKIKLGKIELPNRLGVSPMCQYSSVDGKLNDWHLVHIGGYAKHKVPLIFVEATAVTPNGRISPSDAGIWKDEQIEGHAKVVDFTHKEGSVIGLQIGHAGRKASTQVPWLSKVSNHYLNESEGGWPKDLVAPSAIPWSESKEHYYPTPRALTVDEIKELVKKFGEAAARANKAGYDFLEIHGAHGYLISEFLSPFTNKRDNDAYGGSFENRIRIVLEIIKEIKLNWPKEKPLGIRISCTDYLEGGWGMEDTIKLVKILAEKDEYKLDFIDCSSGGVAEVKMKVYPGYQVPFAHEVKKAIKGTDTKVMTVGLITDPDQSEKILEEDSADIILLARQFLREPSFVQRSSKHFGIVPETVPQYARSWL